MANSLSPAAQAVLDAFSDRHEWIGPFDDDWQEQCIAAALRAAADQVVPEEPEGGMEPRWIPRWIRQSVRRQFLALAAELEGGGTNTTTNTP